MSDLNSQSFSFLAIPRPVETYHTKTYDRISPSKTTFNAKDKTVLITAGGTGVGFSISKAFAEAGVERIIIVSRRPEPQAEAKAELQSKFPNLKVETIPASVTDTARMAQIMERPRGIDVLVMSAAGLTQAARSVDFPTNELKSLYGTNVFASFDLVKMYLSLPPPASGTRTIINISTVGAQMQLPAQIGYGSSKAAFVQILSYLAAEHTPEKNGVRIFSIHPGAFYTAAAAENGFAADALDWEDINLPGHFCVWLASPEADFLHGRFVWAHWDIEELIALKERMEKDPMFLSIGLVQ